MKKLSYIMAFTLISATVSAESITNDELQQRFEQAFNVFNESGKAPVKVINKNAKSDETALKEVKSNTDLNDMNIVKQVNNIDTVKVPARVSNKTDVLTLPEIPNSIDRVKNNFIKLSDRPVFVDAQNETLENITKEALTQASNNETWKLKWRLKNHNKYILEEKMNLTAEVSFDSFIANMLESITNITGIKLTTKVFNKHKIIIITDSF